MRSSWTSRFLDFFRNYPPACLNRRQFHNLLQYHRDQWGIPKSYTFLRLINILISEDITSETIFRRKSPASALKRYSIHKPSALSLGLSLASNSFLSHGSAAYVHDLTNQLPDPLLVNVEQSPKPRPYGKLTQEAIDRAFQNSQRTSRNVWEMGHHRFALLSGKNTGRIGVVEFNSDSGEALQTTNIFRTLVDMTVRPAYVPGGVVEIARMFATVRNRVSGEQLFGTLNQMNYVYPYHQSIGFFMVRAGFDVAELEHFRHPGLKFDFYLTHGMQSPVFDSDWRIYYPASLDSH